MSKVTTFCAITLLMLLLAVGCSDDPVTPPIGDETAVRVDLDPEGADFEIKLDSVSLPDTLMRGPFFLRGHNLHYDDVVGALVVDLTITNASPAIFMNPVNITFLRLFPEGTIVLNSPDDSPTFAFEFENDDLWWTPGEESLPLTVMFQADLGVSVGFNAFISVGGVHLEGVIAGRVWEDVNRDGIMDRGEPGLPNVTMALDNGGIEEILHRAITDRNGRYSFSGLDSGTYEVRVHLAPPGVTSTTPASMHVLLAAGPGGGRSFTEADFGFHFAEVSPPGPKLLINANEWDRWMAFRGETVIDYRVPPGIPLQFRWEGEADRGLQIKAYRWGWDVRDPGDPNDPGWTVAPGLGPLNMAAYWGAPLEPGMDHRLVIHCWDTEEHLTRAIVRFRVDGPDSLR